ncbi:MAG TPA: response regulator [Holophagaceae bacterium]|nr:response regulator [Holophagaceae bacterium]
MSRNWPASTKLLMVEDDPLSAMLLRTRLEMEGLQVRVARNGMEALEMLKADPPDLMTTDLMMPGMDGFRLVKEIRSLPPPLGRVPVLFISANKNDHDMARCLAAGGDDFMTKPYSVDVLVERLWRLHERAGGR